MALTAPDAVRIRRDDAIIRRALAILEDRLRAGGPQLSGPRATTDYLRLRLAEAEHEVFAVLWLDAQNVLIEYQELFRGTLTQTIVHPREVVKDALRCNAAGAILAHNHPAGTAAPSRPDVALTDTLIQALSLVGVEVLDHVIVGGPGEPFSFMSHGLMGKLAPPVLSRDGPAPQGPVYRPEPVEVHPGVTRTHHGSRFSDYLGSAQALTAAGIVPAGRFPGMPGMPKTTLSLNADGIPWPGSPHSRKTPDYRANGSRVVFRKPGATYLVRVYAPGTPPAGRQEDGLAGRRIEAAVSAPSQPATAAASAFE